ncbi:MAG TPA: chemotaxis protein CheW, partial [Polyangiaceae bacterium]|nr:chemotaxis protein CheW [Polyangiaceae bacterium]
MKLHVVFCVAATEYALPVDAVLQMESFAGATVVPGAPPYVAGIVTVRGLVVPVIDLRIRFGLPPAAVTVDTRIIVTRSHERTVALLVDKAREVLKLDEEKHQPAAGAISERSAGFVAFVHSLGPRLLLLVDLSKILGETSHD